jgi:sarcosine oxidase subunit beta
MRRTADAVIVGAGILGTSIGLELARCGVRALVVDRNGEAGDGSTHASSAIIRSFYGTRPAVALAHEGRSVYENWAAHLGIEKPKASYQRVGCALLLPAADIQGDRVAAFMRSAGVELEMLAGREAHGLVPGMRGARTKVLFEPRAGYVTNPGFATRDVRAAAELAGAHFLFGERVVDIRSRAATRNGSRRIAGVVTASGTRIDAPIVINAAGPHSAQVNLLARCPLPLTTAPLAQRVVRGKVDLGEGLPVVADLPGGQYVRFDRHGFKLGTLRPRDDWDYVADADSRGRIPKAFLAEHRRAFHRRHPKLRWREARVRSALYDVTLLDWYPILDRTDLEGFFVAIGTSGAWFKGGPTIGWLMAQLVTAVTAGRDHDQDPLRVTLPRTGAPLDLGFFSRNRKAIKSELGRGVLG